MWAWLAKVLNATTREERAGATLALDSAWEVSAPKDHAQFIRALAHLLPHRSILFLEGGSPDAEITRFLDEHAVPPQLKIALGTIWPKPRVFHLPATADNIERLAQLFENHAAPELCVHFHAYHAGEVVLQWHDAFFNDPLYVSPVIPEQRIRTFCERLGCTYTRVVDNP